MLSLRDSLDQPSEDWNLSTGSYPKLAEPWYSRGAALGPLGPPTERIIHVLLIYAQLVSSGLRIYHISLARWTATRDEQGNTVWCFALDEGGVKHGHSKVQAAFMWGETEISIQHLHFSGNLMNFTWERAAHPCANQRKHGKRIKSS